MRPIDWLTLPLAALWQQKLRTVLTTLGVLFGAFVLAASLSIGQGVQEAMERVSRSNDLARRIDVFINGNPVVPKSADTEIQVAGDVTADRRDRLRKSLARQRQESSPDQVYAFLNRDRLDKMAAIPHVVRVIPDVQDRGFALFGDQSEAIFLRSTRPDDEVRRRRVVAGRFFATPEERGVLVSEFLAYRLGLTCDAEINALIGKPLRLEFRSARPEAGFFVYLRKAGGSLTREERAALDKVTVRLPGSLAQLGLDRPEVETLQHALGDATAAALEPEIRRAEFPVLGITRAPSEEEQNDPQSYHHADADVLLPYSTALDLYFRASGSKDQGVNRATVLVDEDKNVKDVVKAVLALGVDARSATEFIERERLIYLLIFGATTCVAGVALLVAALGIANTMLMSVLERQREIGIMKAVGADNRHLQFIFLFEGALIGLVGAACGLGLAWAVSFPADAWVRSMVLRDIKVDLKGSIFVFPTWVSATVLGFTVLVTTLAAFYPARHASRIDPVSALRHE